MVYILYNCLIANGSCVRSCALQIVLVFLFLVFLVAFVIPPCRHIPRMQEEERGSDTGADSGCAADDRCHKKFTFKKRSTSSTGAHVIIFYIARFYVWPQSLDFNSFVFFFSLPCGVFFFKRHVYNITLYSKYFFIFLYIKMLSSL